MGELAQRMAARRLRQAARVGARSARVGTQGLSLITSRAVQGLESTLFRALDGRQRKRQLRSIARVVRSRLDDRRSFWVQWKALAVPLALFRLNEPLLRKRYLKMALRRWADCAAETGSLCDASKHQLAISTRRGLRRWAGVADARRRDLARDARSRTVCSCLALRSEFVAWRRSVQHSLRLQHLSSLVTHQLQLATRSQLRMTRRDLVYRWAAIATDTLRRQRAASAVLQDRRRRALRGWSHAAAALEMAAADMVALWARARRHVPRVTLMVWLRASRRAAHMRSSGVLATSHCRHRAASAAWQRMAMASAARRLQRLAARRHAALALPWCLHRWRDEAARCARIRHSSRLLRFHLGLRVRVLAWLHWVDDTKQQQALRRRVRITAYRARHHTMRRALHQWSHSCRETRGVKLLVRSSHGAATCPAACCPMASHGCASYPRATYPHAHYPHSCALGGGGVAPVVSAASHGGGTGVCDVQAPLSVVSNARRVLCFTGTSLPTHKTVHAAPYSRISTPLRTPPTRPSAGSSHPSTMPARTLGMPSSRCETVWEEVTRLSRGWRDLVAAVAVRREAVRRWEPIWGRVVSMHARRELQHAFAAMHRLIIEPSYSPPATPSIPVAAGRATAAVGGGSIPPRRRVTGGVSQTAVALEAEDMLAMMRGPTSRARAALRLVASVGVNHPVQGGLLASPTPSEGEPLRV